MSRGFNPDTDDEPAGSAPPSTLRCNAHGCPHRRTVRTELGQLCSAHAAAPPHEWPALTAHLQHLAERGQRAAPPPAARAVIHDPERLRRAAAVLQARMSGAAGSREWAYRLREREQRGERLSKAQRDAWRAAIPRSLDHEAQEA